MVLDYYREDVKILKEQILQQINGDLKYLEELKVVVDDHVETWFVR